jgi:Protein ChrB, N-terminal
MAARGQTQRWVLLCYRLPREPSTPRITVWRKLERLGVARLGDGLVGLPADARTREQFDWLAEEITEAGGAATVWLGSPAHAAQEEAVADGLRQARAAEYAAVITQAENAAAGDADEAARVVRRLREELGRIARRDFFPPPQREQAQAAVQALASATAPGRRSARSR